MVLSLYERRMELRHRLREPFPMHDIVFRDASDGRGKISQYVSEQTEVDMHVNRFVDVISARFFEDQRYAGRIKMRLKSRRAFECADVKLVRVFERYFCLVGDRLGHWAPRYT
jgi:hypothetical protein